MSYNVARPSEPEIPPIRGISSHYGAMRRSRVPLLVIVLALAGAMLVPAGARPLPIGQDPIEPGQAYHGDFPDPTVIKVGSRYYASSTTSDGLNLPTLSSTDTRTWYARPASGSAPAGDALPRTASWSAGVEMPDGRFHAPLWAPSIARLGAGRYVLAYATQVAGVSGQHMCISVATGSSPAGPFTDRSTRPLVCPSRGAIDPQIFVSPQGRPWLIWRRDHYPALLLTQPMTKDGTGLVTSARIRVLAGVAQPWEGRVVEGPAMIAFRGRYYLFYSANFYATTRYAIGYLICKTWYGGCVRPRKRPLLATGGSIAGPGGGSPFVDSYGRLRLAYHAWSAGAVGYADSLDCKASAAGCGQRRLYVATLRPDRFGKLLVVHRR
jgi:beta-xylosidase